MSSELPKPPVDHFGVHGFTDDERAAIWDHLAEELAAGNLRCVSDEKKRAASTQANVESGLFTSPDEAIAAGVRLLRQQEEAEDARTLEGIRQGLEDIHAGRGRAAEEVFADIRREFNLAPDRSEPRYPECKGKPISAPTRNVRPRETSKQQADDAAFYRMSLVQDSHRGLVSRVVRQA